MTVAQLTETLGWMTILNLAMYCGAVFTIMAARDWIERLHGRMFAMTPEALRPAYLGYLARYKLLILVFCLTPWIALKIIG
ncbi:MAG: DUF6868 family protein [Pseudomonadota bacterium]